jgi:hypothetical protein
LEPALNDFDSNFILQFNVTGTVSEVGLHSRVAKNARNDTNPTVRIFTKSLASMFAIVFMQDAINQSGDYKTPFLFNCD